MSRLLDQAAAALVFASLGFFFVGAVTLGFAAVIAAIICFCIAEVRAR